MAAGARGAFMSSRGSTLHNKQTTLSADSCDTFVQTKSASSSVGYRTQTARDTISLRLLWLSDPEKFCN